MRRKRIRGAYCRALGRLFTFTICNIEYSGVFTGGAVGGRWCNRPAPGLTVNFLANFALFRKFVGFISRLNRIKSV